MSKPTKWHVRPAKTQISLAIRPVWSESSLSAEWVVKDPSFLRADSEDFDQTGRMPMLISVFAGRTCQFVGFDMRRHIFYCQACYWRLTKTSILYITVVFSSFLFLPQVWHILIDIPDGFGEEFVTEMSWNFRGILRGSGWGGGGGGSQIL